MKRTGSISKAIFTLAIAVLMAAWLLAPVGALAKDKKDKKKAPPPIDTSGLTWPAPPNQARIKYVGVYTGEDVLPPKKKAGFLERMAGVRDETVRLRMIKPYGVAVDSKGRAYVADSAMKAIFVFDVDNKTLSLRGDKPPAAFRVPIGVAVDESDRLFVSDATLRTITCFSPTGEVLGIFGSDELQRPAGLAIDNVLRRLYVADVKARRIAMFDLDSYKLTGWMGKPVDGDADEEGRLISPTNVAVDPDGMLYVVDTFNNRIQVFGSDGEPAFAFGKIGQGAGAFARPRGIAFDSDGHVYVVDALRNQFQIFTADGKPLIPVGAMGPNPGQFNVPAAIAIDKDNRIFVTDQLNSRVQVFRYITEEEAAAGKGKNTQAELSPAAGGQNAPK